MANTININTAQDLTNAWENLREDIAETTRLGFSDETEAKKWRKAIVEIQSERLIEDAIYAEAEQNTFEELAKQNAVWEVLKAAGKTEEAKALIYPEVRRRAAEKTSWDWVNAGDRKDRVERKRIIEDGIEEALANHN